MPSFSQALSSILLTSALTTWPITTTTAHPLFLSDGDRRNDRRRAGKYKNSKKQTAQQCTPDVFAGVYKYVNCKKMVTQVAITCDNDNGINKCDYKETPMNDDNGDDVCVVKGSFDATYVMMDPARPGVCQLNFVSLKNSCKADALPPGFGMRAEVDMTAGHADTSSTNMLLLWFSNDRGVVYYNEDDPRVTAFLQHGLPPRRNLQSCPDSDNRYYVPDEHYCYSYRDSGYYCWYPEDKFPVGDNWGSGGIRPLNECGHKCPIVCDSPHYPCQY